MPSSYSSHHFNTVAGWSSPVARRAHNPKVVGSNPAPATNFPYGVPLEESQITTQVAQSALTNLKEALSLKSPSKLERDGTIQRFEYSYELIWKLARRVLKENEVEADVPKAIFRELGRLDWIQNVESWLSFQKSRNETSHEYGEKLAQKSYELAKIFLPLAESLLETLKTKLND